MMQWSVNHDDHKDNINIFVIFLSRLEEQAEAWHGPLSAALYVRKQEVQGPDWEATLASIGYFALFASPNVQRA
jgi:hypothetical protein